jgi:hypothetical protein
LSRPLSAAWRYVGHGAVIVSQPDGFVCRGEKTRCVIDFRQRTWQRRLGCAFLLGSAPRRRPKAISPGTTRSTSTAPPDRRA